MLKKISLPLLLLVAGLLLIPTPQAAAAVRFGVFIGGPVYAHPVYPRPYVYPYPYAYAPYPAYGYVEPAYVYPYTYWGGYWGGHRRHEWREHEWREHHYRRYRGYYRRY